MKKYSGVPFLRLVSAFLGSGSLKNTKCSGNTWLKINLPYVVTINISLSSSFFFTLYEDIGFGDIEFIPTEYAKDPSVPDYAIIIEDLKIDGEYDINELGSKAGKLTIYIDDETVSYERLAELILEIKKIFDDANLKFYALDFVLEYPKNENGTKKEGRVEVRDFLYADIYEEDMIERVKASDKAANEYYAEQDAEKHLNEQK